MKACYSVVIASILALFINPCLQAETSVPAPDRGAIREQAQKYHRQGNYKEALDSYVALATDPKELPEAVPGDLQGAVSCMQSLTVRTTSRGGSRLVGTIIA